MMAASARRVGVGECERAAICRWLISGSVRPRNGFVTATVEPLAVQSRYARPTSS